MSELIFSQYENLQWKIQDAGIGSLVFYQLNDSESAEATLKNFIESSEFKLLVLNRRPRFKIDKPVHIANDFFQLQKEACDFFYPILPGKKLIGVTGTNGKSTVTFLAQQIANENGLKSFCVGSLGVWENQKELESLKGMTTPPFIDLRRILFNHFKNNECCFMEVSSHALKQKRVYGLRFDHGAWTNFTQDHLDYHQTMDDYFESKKLFFEILDDSMVIPSEEKSLVDKLVNYNIKKVDNFKTPNYSFFKVAYNKINFSVAYELVAMAIKRKELKIEFDFLFPSGRFEVVTKNDLKAVIDNAHTPDAIEKIITSAKQAFPNNRIITIFGCGGDRDPSKRSEMGELALKYSDEVIITSDNPRTENPEDIIKEITMNLKGDFEVVINRKDAISLAKERSNKDSVILILGKGSEDYQIIGNEKFPYSDKEEFLK